jgi:uncharacterized protein YuzE
VPVKPDSYYTPDGDIAYLRVREPEGAVRAREEPWGLRDFDERGELVGIEVWEASERLPRELVEALPRLEGHGVTIERQPA